MRRESRMVLDDVSLCVGKGDFLAITGPNGGGKTTLMRIILGLLKPTAGSVRYFESGRPTSAQPKFGYLPQKNAIDSHFPISVEETVASGLMMEKTADKDKLVDDTLRLIGLEDLRRRPIGQLSGGQLQRTLFGRAIIRHPDILVLDEPLSYIDKRFETRLYEIIKELSAHTTILLVSHELSSIASMANRHLIIDRTLTECHATHHYIPPVCE